MEYQLCGLQIDCNTLREFGNCFNTTDCVSGCFCSNDYVLEDGKCIDPIMCPGELYQSLLFTTMHHFLYMEYSYNLVATVVHVVVYSHGMHQLSTSTYCMCSYMHMQHIHMYVHVIKGKTKGYN